ncbi:MAG TPA: hypothetical protein VF490_10955 [Chryseosolibacter sp.]
MKKITFTFFLSAFALTVLSQEFEVPGNYKFERAEDYSTYEPAVLKGITWITATPLDQQEAKRKKVNAFLLEWLSGSPYVHLELKKEIVTFVNSPDLLMVFMGGWAKYSLESKDFNNKVAGSLAGIEAVIGFYSRNKNAIKKDKNVEKYIKMKESGTLKEYVEKNA